MLALAAILSLMIDRFKKEKFSFYYVALSVAFCVCLMVANLVEIKTITIGGVTITGGLLLFPIVYIINDCVTEVYGLAKTKMMVWMGFFASVTMMVSIQVVMALPGSDEWLLQAEMEAIFGNVPRIILASYVAFLAGSFTNAYVMNRMRERYNSTTKDEGFTRRYKMMFVLRAIVSTIFGEGIDSLVFFPIAFAGILSWGMIGWLVLSQIFIKTLYEVLVMPITVRVVRYLLKAEGWL